jgi:hypothetical protein
MELSPVSKYKIIEIDMCTLIVFTVLQGLEQKSRFECVYGVTVIGVFFRFEFAYGTTVTGEEACRFECVYGATVIGAF